MRRRRLRSPTFVGLVCADLVKEPICELREHFSYGSGLVKWRGVQDAGAVCPRSPSAISGRMGVDENAIEAVRRFRFKPAMGNGKPVTVEMNIDVDFQIF